jgi:hypothetical protein
LIKDIKLVFLKSPSNLHRIDILPVSRVNNLLETHIISLTHAIVSRTQLIWVSADPIHAEYTPIIISALHIIVVTFLGVAILIHAGRFLEVIWDRVRFELVISSWCLNSKSVRIECGLCWVLLLLSLGEFLPGRHVIL